MDWAKIKAALIRFFWTAVFPAIGLGIERLFTWATTDGNLQSIGIESMPVIVAIAAVLYGLKKLLWPDTTW